MPKGLGKGYEQLSKEDKENIVTMFQEGKSYSEIYRAIPCTRRAVPKVMTEYGIKAKRKNRYTLNEGYFVSDITQRKAYWLGLISADGCITKTNYFALQLSGEDGVLLSKLKEDINYTGEICTKPNGFKQEVHRINFSSKTMCDSLRQIGILEHKIETRNIIPNIPEDLIRHYMRGYFDGDGSITLSYSSSSRNGKTYIYPKCSVNIAMTYPLARQWQRYILQQIGYDAKIHKSKCDQICYLVFCSKHAISDLYHLLYAEASIYLIRKHNKWLQFLSAYSG